jgi:acyl-CoA hydrolase
MEPNKPDRTPITLLEEIFPQDTNPYGTAFGGKILALMDRAAGLAASRYAHGHFVTASMDAMQFYAPVLQGEVAEVVARVAYTSARTCAIKVEVNALDKVDWQRRHCCTGLIFMVARDPKGRILPVPPLKLTSEQDRHEWGEAAQVHKRMLEKKKR